MVAWRPIRGASVAAFAALACAGATLCHGDSAYAQGLSLPGAGVSVAGIGASVPSVGVSLPDVGSSVSHDGSSASSAGLSLPSIGVTIPSVGVTVPSVGVSLPGVSVSTPEVSVSTPAVSTSTPEVSVGTSGSGSSEASGGGGGSSGGGSSGGGGGGSTGGGGSSGGGATGGGSSGSGNSGGGGGGSSGQSPSSAGNGSDVATTASVSDSAAAPATSSLAATHSHAAAANGVRRRPAARRVSATGRPRRAGGGGDSAPGAAALLVSAVRPEASGAAGARRGASRSAAAKDPASNPLDTLGKQIPLPLPVPDWSKPIILALLLLAIYLGLRSRTATRRATRLERQRASLLRDVDVMQEALVPEIPARVGGLGVSVAYRPAEGPAAGGDFYDVFAPARGKVAMILGDVAGHGPRALKRAALTRYTLRAYLQAGLEPRAALALAGRVLADPTAEHFATVALAVYDQREGLLTYASAGHPPPLLQGLQTREPLTVCASPPVGWTVPTGRRQTRVSLVPGAVVCFFSDGLVEARCKQELLGRERLGEILASLGPRPDATKLLAAVRTAALATPDDMAACILMPELGVVGAVTHVEELEADVKALDAGQVRRFLEVCQVPVAEIDAAIDLAGEIAAISGTTLLRVELDGVGAGVTVSVPDAEQDAVVL
jgi:hypothetical protein